MLCWVHAGDMVRLTKDWLNQPRHKDLQEPCLCVCGTRGRGMWEKWSARLWKYECMWECARACVCVRWDTIACSIKPLTYIDHIHIKVPSLNPGPFSRHLVYWYQSVLWDRNAQLQTIVFFSFFVSQRVAFVTQPYTPSSEAERDYML